MSRDIHLEDGCRLRFPGQSSAFADGVEVGILAAQMDRKPMRLSRFIATSSVGHVRALACKLGYRLTIERQDEVWTRVALRRVDARPMLRVVGRA